MYNKKREKIIEFMLKFGTDYEDVFENDPEGLKIYLEECKKFLCDGYLDEDLSPEERSKFERMLGEDQALRDQLITRYNIDEFIKEEGVLLADLNTIHNEIAVNQNDHKSPKKVKKAIRSFEKMLSADTNSFFTNSVPLSNFRFKSIFENGNWVAGASIVLLCFIAIWLGFNKPGDLSLQNDLFAQYYQPLESDEVYAKSDIITKAKTKYYSGDYDESYSLYKLIYNDYDIEEEVHFYYALNMIELGLYGNAIKQLEHIIKNYPASEQLYYVNWYLSLCYIKKDQPDLAKPLLEDIANSKGYNHKNAARLLKTLSKFSYKPESTDQN